jgi:hypothetical protein
MSINSTQQKCDVTKKALLLRSNMNVEDFCVLCEDLGVRCRVGHHRNTTPDKSKEGLIVIYIIIPCFLLY